MTKENRVENARRELAAGADALRAAELILNAGLLRDAMSRLYYAAFHGARALLLLEGLQAKSHAGVFHLFNEHVVRRGILSASYNLLLVRLQGYRLASDYAASFDVEPASVEQERVEVEGFLDLVRHQVG